MKTILVPVDGSEGANKAAKFAAGLARDTGARLVLLHVYDAPTVAAMGMRHLSDEEVAKVRERIARGSFDAAGDAMGDRYAADAYELAIGHPAQEICAHAERHGVDLVVMGSRGRSEVQDLLLGSVSEKVLRHAPCPVTVVR